MNRYAAALFAAVVSIGCASTQPVAVVDMSRALQECREGRAAVSDLRARWATYQARLDQGQAALKLKLEQIKAERARGLPVEEERDAAAKREMADLEFEYFRLQQQLSDEERQRAEPIKVRLEAALSKLAQTRRFARVDRVSPIAPGNDGRIDITLDLIRAVDAEPARAPR
jgi:Skp family chaperone for outer membrane proteins